jgi:putative copper resistance protein D
LAQFLDLFGFLSVLLRAATLSFGAVTLGGGIFSLIVLRGAAPPGSVRRLLTFSAFGLAATQVLYIGSTSAILLGTTNLSLKEIAGADYFVWACSSFVAAVAVATIATMGRAGARTLQITNLLVILAATVGTSHAASRLEHKGILVSATAIHQLATGAWIGGLPYLVLTLRCKKPMEALVLSRRFSRLAIVSVGLLLAAGVTLSIFYIATPAALYGTTYGVMVVAKVMLFGLVLSLGAVNFRLIRDRGRDESGWLRRLKRISEAEIGIGITAILAAASLTSQPPAVDLVKDRVSLESIAKRFSPKLPHMETPPLSTLSPSTRELWKKDHPPDSSLDEAYVPGQEAYIPPTKGDIEWSEYNHHWAGLVVLFIGILATLCSYRFFGWARHWPIAFAGLAAFLLFRADPENWPLGPSGFWESFTSADVAQHRMFVLLILMFAAFEWGVQTNRLKAPAAALVFPGVCAAGGALLLTHMHGVTNLQEELLAELSHTPIALLAVVSGWTRWLELRLPRPGKLNLARIWPACFAFIGVVLLLYREA